MKHARGTLFAALLLFVAPACKSAYYKTMESMGYQKRDILVRRVEDAREEQDAAQEQFQTTLEAFQAVTGFEGGDLERLYGRLESEYQEASERAGKVRERIDAVEEVSGDMFEEWQGEIDEISDPELRARSEDMLRATRGRYQELVAKMNAAAAKMDPVLVTFHDHVLFLKHNLNAMAIDSLRETSLEIEGEVSALVADMQASIAEADAFIQSMSS